MYFILVGHIFAYKFLIFYAILFHIQYIPPHLARFQVSLLPEQRLLCSGRRLTGRGEENEWINVIRHYVIAKKKNKMKSKLFDISIIYI